MKQRLSFYVFYFCLLLNLSAYANDPIRALIVTGGHSFDRSALFNMFDSFKDFSYTEAIQPKGNILIQEGGAAAFDVLIFYDMYDSITEDQKEAYIKLLRKGKPVIFLHHALVSYQHWPEFFHVIGGKFVRGDTTNGGSVYKHDVIIPIQVAPGNHEITRGLEDFSVFDETYGKCLIKDTVRPLLTTKCAGNMPYIAWVNKYYSSQIVYIQIGHGPDVFYDGNYREVLYRAIRWSVDAHAGK